jgi:hypothetical protein
MKTVKVKYQEEYVLPPACVHCNSSDFGKGIWARNNILIMTFFYEGIESMLPFPLCATCNRIRIQYWTFVIGGGLIVTMVLGFFFLIMDISGRLPGSLVTLGWILTLAGGIGTGVLIRKWYKNNEIKKGNGERFPDFPKTAIVQKNILFNDKDFLALSFKNDAYAMIFCELNEGEILPEKTEAS